MCLYSNRFRNKILSNMNQKLRIGLLLDDYFLPAWSYKMLEEINNLTCAEIVLIIKNKNEKKRESSLLKRILGNPKQLLFLLYERADRSLFKSNPNPFKQIDIRSFLIVKTIEVDPIKINFNNEISEVDIINIKKSNIDILIKLGFEILQGNILKVPKYGIWSLFHGDINVYRGLNPGVWEVLDQRNETGAVLQILTEDPYNGKLLSKTYSQTDSISPNRNKYNYYWKALYLIPSKIQELYELGENEFLKRIEELNKHPHFYSNKLYTKPSNIETFVNVAKLLFKKLKKRIYLTFFFDQWILLFNINKTNTISTSFLKFKKMIPTKDRLWADPHILKRNGKYYIFIEELIYAKGKAHISVIVMDENGSYKDPVKVLERDYHLSYPFIMEDNDELFMIPETKQNSTIELFKCVEFPYKWEFERVLIDNILALDSTIEFRDGKYWLFTNVVRTKGVSAMDELFLFVSDKLNSGDWKSHPQNPIVSDFRQARPAGKLFTYKDKLYRPSQDSSKHYGYGMKINEVIELDESNYKEVVIDSIIPNWDKTLSSTHTLNSISELTIIDAQMQRKRWF